MTKNIFGFFLIIICACQTSSPTTTPKFIEAEVPTHFDDGERIILKMPTLSGDTLNIYSDSGGGFTAIYPDAIKRIGKDTAVLEIEADGGQMNFIMADQITNDPIFHAYLNSRMTRRMKAPIFAIPDQDFVRPMNKENYDGFFGQFFFLDKAWYIDYPNQKLMALPQLNKSDFPTSQFLGLKLDGSGKPLFGHPSMFMEVQGDTIPMLFDTGAMFHLSDQAQEVMQRKEFIGGSFIGQSVFEKWRTNNPTWRVIEKGDVIQEGEHTYEFDMIEVPQITLGEHSVGPVWFSMRPDAAWSKGMIRTMDKVVKGALGSSGLKYLKVAVDYRQQFIAFEL